MMTTDQFAEKLKAKYPSYINMDNKELVDKTIAKYPSYAKYVSDSPQSLKDGLLESAKNLAVDGGKTALNLGGTAINLITGGNANLGYGTDNRFKGDIVDKAVEGAKEGFDKGNQLRKDTVNVIEDTPGVKDNILRAGANILGGAETLATTTFGGIAGATDDILSPTFEGGVNSLPDNYKNVLGDKMNELSDWYQSLDNNQQLALRHAGVLGETALTFLTGSAGKNTQKTLTKTLNKLDDFTDPLRPILKNTIEQTGEKLANSRNEISSSLISSMNKVNPNKQKEFITLSKGDTIGDFLLKRDIVGNNEEVLEKLADRFQQAKKNIDDGMAQVEGLYKPKSAEPVLNDMLDYYSKTADRDNLSLTQKRLQKLNSEGLTLSEFNSIKRDFEKNVRTGYLRDNNAEKIQRNTNLDNQMRLERDEIATSGGFSNIKDLSKEIQLTKYALDSINDKAIRQLANNTFGLVDNMLMIGGAVNPGALGLLGIKKVLSSDYVKSGLIKALKTGDVSTMKNLDVVPAKIINIKNKQKRIQEYQNWLKDSGLNDLIRQAKGEKQTPLLLEEAKTINLPESNNLETRAEFTRSNPSELSSFDEKQAKIIGGDTQSSNQVLEVKLIEEAKNYKTADEFIKSQGTPVYHGTNVEFDKFDESKINSIEQSGDYVGEGFYFTKDVNKAKKYAQQTIKKNGGKEVVIEAYLDMQKPFVINNKKDVEKLNTIFGGEEARIELSLDNPSEIRKILQNNGYDGLIDNMYGQSAVFDPSQIKTRPQLEAIWKEAKELKN